MIIKNGILCYNNVFYYILLKLYNITPKITIAIDNGIVLISVENTVKALGALTAIIKKFWDYVKNDYNSINFVNRIHKIGNRMKYFWLN